MTDKKTGLSRYERHTTIIGLASSAISACSLALSSILAWKAIAFQSDDEQSKQALARPHINIRNMDSRQIMVENLGPGHAILNKITISVDTKFSELSSTKRSADDDSIARAILSIPALEMILGHQVLTRVNYPASAYTLVSGSSLSIINIQAGERLMDRNSSEWPKIVGWLSSTPTFGDSTHISVEYCSVAYAQDCQVARVPSSL